MNTLGEMRTVFSMFYNASSHHPAKTTILITHKATSYSEATLLLLYNTLTVYHFLTQHLSIIQASNIHPSDPIDIRLLVFSYYSLHT
jgi:hypothetical protein